jgi:hypothetical protein
MEQINIKQYLQKAINLVIDGDTKDFITFEHPTEPQIFGCSLLGIR